MSSTLGSFVAHFRVVDAIDHVKQVTTDQSGQTKKLLKSVEATARVIERAKVSVEKALKEANAHAATLRPSWVLFHSGL